MLRYKGYTIRPLETPEGRSRAEIRRIDGRKLFIPITEQTRESLTSEPPQRIREDAMFLAEQAIDGGGIKLAA